MNWDAIGAIGQMLGAAAVFISLGYLGVQLRGANLTAKHASQNSFIGDYTRFLSDLYLHPEVVDMTRKGFLEGLASLDQNEKSDSIVFAQRTTCLPSTCMFRVKPNNSTKRWRRGSFSSSLPR